MSMPCVLAMSGWKIHSEASLARTCKFMQNRRSKDINQTARDVNCCVL